jgi:hypothetical protein
MNKETLRMQMLAGVITEGQYKEKLEELTQKDSLNEHYVAGGIVGIGAINQIPSRAKEVYEDAFEHFLGQKYSINEAEEMSVDMAADKVENAVDDKLEATVDALTDEQKEQLRAELAKAGITANTDPEAIAGKLDESLFEAEGDAKAKIANALSNIGGGLMKSLLVPIIPVAIGSMGPGVAAGLAITAGTAGILIALAKALGAEKSMEEGKEEIEEAEGMSGKDFALQKIKPYLEKEGYKIGFFNDVSSIPISKMKDDPTLAALALDSREDVTIVIPNDDKGQKILFTSTSDGELIKDLDLKNHFNLNKRFYGDGLGLYLMKK